MLRAIVTDQAPQAIGPYSQAVLVSNSWIFCSGQIGCDPNTGELISEHVEDQMVLEMIITI